MIICLDQTYFMIIYFLHHSYCWAPLTNFSRTHSATENSMIDNLWNTFCTASRTVQNSTAYFITLLKFETLVRSLIDSQPMQSLMAVFSFSQLFLIYLAHMHEPLPVMLMLLAAWVRPYITLWWHNASHPRFSSQHHNHTSTRMSHI